MSKLEFWLFKRFVRKFVRQGANHRSNIEWMYQEIWDCCCDEFTEDSPITLKGYLQRRFNVATRWTQDGELMETKQ